jgi:hypothetical protein
LIASATRSLSLLSGSCFIRASIKRLGVCPKLIRPWYR